MLSELTIDAVVLANDLGAAKNFYGGKVGHEVLIETEDFVTSLCGGDSRFLVTRSTTATSETPTKANWRVDGIRWEVAELRSRGIEFEDDDSSPKTVEGIADLGFVLSAWFNAPAGNNIGPLEFKDRAFA